MTDEQRQRRAAAASELWAAVEPYMSVEPTARMKVVESELIYAIDACLKKHDQHRFKEAEIEILKETAVYIVVLLDRLHRRKTGFCRSTWHAFTALDPLKKIGTVATVIAAVGASIAWGASMYDKHLRTPTIEKASDKLPPAPGARGDRAITTAPKAITPNQPDAIPLSSERPTIGNRVAPAK